MSHFKEVCRSSKNSVVHNMETEADQEQETDIQMVNINSINFNSNHPTIIANLKTLKNKVIITVLYKVDMSSDGNTIPLYIYKNIIS